MRIRFGILEKLGRVDLFEAWRVELIREVAGDPPGGRRWVGLKRCRDPETDK
jgi:hypothetical protein